MNDPELIITGRIANRKGYVVLNASLNKKSIFTDEIRIANAKARSDFVKRLCDGRKGISKNDVNMQLEDIAGRIDTLEVNRSDATSSSDEYRFTDSGIEYLKPTWEGSVPVKLTNFAAQIVSDIIKDDGIERKHFLEIEAHLSNRTHRFTILASKFISMNWCIDHLGPKAIVFAGFSRKDHTRVAIQHLSSDIETHVIFVHTGWREIEGHGQCYLHAAGAIGPKGPVKDIEVQLPIELSRFMLPDPPEGDDLHIAIQSAVKLLDIGPRHITYSLFAAVLRAALGNTDFSIHLAGATGVFKSELAALFQSFFGKTLDARSLPGSWSSTENALEELCFVAKDSVVVVDDFAPTGTSSDIPRYHKKADRVFRAQGNRSGRGRLKSDGTLKNSRPPRGMILSTGEDIPAGESLRARLFVLELSQGDIGTEQLTSCQEDARAGRYAESMVGFIQWVAGRYDDIRVRLDKRIPELRNEAAKMGQHQRTPTIVAELHAGFEVFLTFTEEVGALSVSEVDNLRIANWEALGEAAAAQAQHHEASEPTKVFLQLLRSAITSGVAHVADVDGEAPISVGPEALGWRKHNSGAGNYQDDEWRPLGALVGWINDDNLYLEPGAAFKVAQKMATETDRINVQMKTLIKRLREKGHLVTWDKVRKKNIIRIHLQGSRRSVLHLRATLLILRAQRAQQTQKTVTCSNSEGNEGPNWVKNETQANSDPLFGPTTCSNSEGKDKEGPIGPIGPKMEEDTVTNITTINSHSVSPVEEEEEEVEEWTG